VIGLCGIEAWVLADWMRQRRGARRVDDGEKPACWTKPGASLLHPLVNSDRKRALAIVRQTVAIANSNTGNFNFLSTLISKAARAG
jgi:hypothetical protein